MPETSRTSSWVPMFVAVCLVAVNMRMSVAGIGPMLDSIARSESVQAGMLGMLASLPLLAWALVSPLAQGLASRIGLDAAVSWALVALLGATIWRSLPGSPINLWLGTALVGAALAITNVLLPASIKRDFGPRVPLVMGVYSALLGVSAAIGAAIVAPVAELQTSSGGPLGWRWGMLATGVTVPAALLAWWLATRRGRREAVARGASEPGQLSQPQETSLSRRVWSDPVAWWIAVYMGSVSWVFYIHAMWLSPIDLSRRADTVVAGGHVTFFHVFGMIGSLVAPLITRGAMQRFVPILIPLVGVVGGIGVVFLPEPLLLVWLVLLGFCSGASLSIALTFIALRSPNTQAAGAVSGMSQSFGYLMAGLGPILFGWLHAMSGAWALPLLVPLFGAAVQFVAGVALLRGRMALGNSS